MTQTSQWDNSYQSAQDDTLLGCLTILAKSLAKPHSGDALVAGLPLVDNKLTPALFDRQLNELD